MTIRQPVPGTSKAACGLTMAAGTKTQRQIGGEPPVTR
jgi:hypothetical protein